MTGTQDEQECPAWTSEVSPDPADFQEPARRFAKVHVVVGWCQLCGGRIKAGRAGVATPAEAAGRLAAELERRVVADKPSL